jgi:hypothetical protein
MAYVRPEDQFIAHWDDDDWPDPMSPRYKSSALASFTAQELDILENLLSAQGKAKLASGNLTSQEINQLKMRVRAFARKPDPVNLPDPIPAKGLYNFGDKNPFDPDDAGTWIPSAAGVGVKPYGPVSPKPYFVDPPPKPLPSIVDLPKNEPLPGPKSPLEQVLAEVTRVYDAKVLELNQARQENLTLRKQHAQMNTQLDETKKVLFALDELARTILKNDSIHLQANVKDIVERWFAALPGGMKSFGMKAELGDLTQTLSNFVSLLIVKVLKDPPVVPEPKEDPIISGDGKGLF